MKPLRLMLLRGVCQTPAYTAHERGFFRDEGLDSTTRVAPTAWQVPRMLADQHADFAIIPWTRVATSRTSDHPLVVLAGSGIEEAAIVVRQGLDPSQVRRVAIPREGGMKDLTAMAMLDSLGWKDAEIVRQPSGDGAVLALVGQGVDAASMVEPYATMMEELHLGRVVRRTGDLWPGAPGCSLCCTARLLHDDPAFAQAVVRAHVRGAEDVRLHPEQAAAAAHRYIGIAPAIIARAIALHPPDVSAVSHRVCMQRIMALMIQLGYLQAMPDEFCDLRFLTPTLSTTHP